VDERKRGGGKVQVFIETRHSSHLRCAMPTR
jgi:hypothetical protein